MSRTAVDLWVGIFVTGGLVALLVLALKVGNASSVSETDGYRVSAEFENIGGLKVRAPIKSSGVVVGRVDRIQLDTQKYVSRVTLLLDKSYKFPKDSIASILTAGLLGEQYVDLSAGGDEQVLKEGETMKMTQSAFVLEKVIGQFLFSKASEGTAQK